MAKVHSTPDNINYFFDCPSVLYKTDFSILGMWEDLDIPPTCVSKANFHKQGCAVNCAVDKRKQGVTPCKTLPLVF